MKSSGKYKILPEYNIIIEVFSGDVSIEDLLSIKQQQAADKLYKPGMDHLTDIRNTNFERYSQDIENNFNNYIANLKNHKHYQIKSKSALLTHTPNQVALSELFSNFIELPIKYKIFSTTAASLQWLGVENKHIPDIEQIIKEI